jgi:glycosyltransferase involved in cell wall biosynthesis
MKAYNQHKIDQSLYFMRDRGGVPSLRADGAANVFLGQKAVEANISNLVRSRGVGTVTLFSHFHLSRYLKRDGAKVYLELHDTPPATVAPVAKLKGHYDQIVVPSVWSKNWVHAEAGVPTDKIKVVPNFINQQTFFCDDRDALNHSGPRPVLWVGRLDERKNWRDAVYVASILKKRGLRIKPIFVLSLRSEDEYVHDFMNQLALHDVDRDTRIYFNLSQAELGDMMRDVRIEGGCFLSTSRLESYGLGIVESMACGLPVVSSAVGAVPEHIRHGETGYLFAFGERLLAADMVEECLFVRQSRKRVLEGLAEIDVGKHRQDAVQQLLQLM